MRRSAMNESSFAVFFVEGVQLVNRFESGLSRKDVFTPVIQYNIAAMAIEKLYMALLFFRGVQPCGHTLTEIAYSVKQAAGLDPLLEDDLARLDSMQQICSFDDFSPCLVSDDDIPFIRDVLDRVRKSVTEITGPPGEQNVKTG
jgi:hypothetical protein